MLQKNPRALMASDKDQKKGIKGPVRKRVLKKDSSSLMTEKGSGKGTNKGKIGNP